MKSYGASTLAALASGHVALVQLVLFAFPSGDVALNNSTWDLTYGGKTYRGAYGLGSIGTIKDAPGEIQGLRLEMDGGSSASVALALDGADEVQGTPFTIRRALIETSTYTILDAPVEWAGTLDTMSLSEDGQTAVISVTAESKAVDLLRGNPSTYTDADQQALYPGDRAFEYVVAQADKPVVWPAREYFYK